MPRARRAIRGDGSIYRADYKTKDGRTVVRWVTQVIEYNAAGKKIGRRSFSGPTAEACRASRDKWRANNKTERNAMLDKSTVGGYLDRWLPEHQTQIDPSTYRSYEQAVRLHIKPFIGTKKLTEIDTLDISTLLADLAKAGRSTRIVRNAYAVISVALDRAVYPYKLIAANPVRGLKPPRHKAKKIAPLTRDQANDFLAAAHGDRLYPLYVLAILCGIREGELFGLQWSDLDLRAGRLAVRRQVTEGRKDGYWIVELDDYTKTNKDRSIKLPAVAIDALREHRKAMMAEGQAANELLFCAKGGAYLRKSNFLRRSFFPLLEKAKCPRVRFHDLRHTCATLLFEQGVHPKIVQELLGHSSVKITLDTYSAWIPTMQEKAADAMQAMFGA